MSTVTPGLILVRMVPFIVRVIFPLVSEINANDPAKIGGGIITWLRLTSLQGGKAKGRVDTFRICKPFRYPRPIHRQILI